MSPADNRKQGRGSEKSSGRRSSFPLILSLFVSAFLVSGCEFQRHPRERPARDTGLAPSEAAEIEAMLHASAESWNSGDLEGFLDDYLNSDSLTFSGPQGVTRGWADVRERYLRTYWAPGLVRDSLCFEEIEVHPIGATEGALALGRYVLYSREEGAGEPASGFFSMVLRRVDDGWKIIHDHTSATPTDSTSEG